MKISFSKLLTMIVVVTGYSLAVAGETTTDATVLRLTGSLTATIPGQASAIVLKVGDHVPQGATVTTGGSSVAYIQTLSGAVSTLEAHTSVVLETLSATTDDAGKLMKQTAMLDLKSGTIVSTIDPAKRAINNYGVRTPKGVAAARGTAFTASVDGDQVQLVATADQVSFTSSLGSVTVLSSGMVSINGGTPMSAADAVMANPNVQALMTQAVSVLAVIVANNVGNISAAGLTTLTSQVVAAAVQVNPAMASTYNSTMTAAINVSAAYSGGGAADAISALNSATNQSTGSFGSSSTNSGSSTKTTLTPPSNITVPPVSPSGGRH